MSDIGDDDHSPGPRCHAYRAEAVVRKTASPPGPLRPRMRRRRVVIVGCLGLVLLSGWACWNKWGQDFGSGVVNQARDRGGEVLGPLRDSVVALAGRTYDDSIRPRLDSTLTSLLDTLQRRVVRLEDTTAVQIQGSLNLALQRMLAQNMALLRDSMQRSLALVADSLRPHFIPLLADGADSATARAVRVLNEGLDGPLRATLLSLVVEISDSVRSAARRTVQEPVFTSLIGRLGLIGGLIAGGLIAAVIAALIIISLGLRNSRRALEAVTVAVQQQGTPELKRAVRDRAAARKVEGWLHAYLAKKDLL